MMPKGSAVSVLCSLLARKSAMGLYAAAAVATRSIFGYLSPGAQPAIVGAAWKGMQPLAMTSTARSAIVGVARPLMKPSPGRRPSMMPYHFSQIGFRLRSVISIRRAHE